MRILLAAIHDLQDLTWNQIAPYLRLNPRQVVVNLRGLAEETENTLRGQYDRHDTVSFESFNPADSTALKETILKSQSGYDVIVCPPEVTGFTTTILQDILGNSSARSTLKYIGCPNDAITHLSGIKDHAAQAGISIINTPNVHAQAVAEYTLSQMIFHARKFSEFYRDTGLEGSWQHEKAIGTTHGLRGRTLGVIGGSGKDGSAVIALGLKMGAKVLGWSPSAEGARKIKDLGATAVDTLESLIRSSEFISINSRVDANNPVLIGKEQIGQMVRGVIIVNPAGAEIIEKQALMAELSSKDCRIAALILDMPYGRRRDNLAFAIDPDNAALKDKGVLFTPRMAGYTKDTCIQATEELAERLDQQFKMANPAGPSGRHPTPVDASDAATSKLLADIIELAAAATRNSIRLRDAGLHIEYKADASPSTFADHEAEKLIREGLRKRGHEFVFIGEESQESKSDECAREIVIDGIDGTRNFIDGNYGWCVSVAVREQGVTVIGVIHDPCCRQTFHAVKGRGAFTESEGVLRELRVPAAMHQDFSFSVGSFRVKNSVLIKNRIIEDIKKLGGRERAWGSVALSICGVARGGLGAFIQGNSHLHDHIAARLVAEEAGAVVVTHATSPDIEDVIVCHPSIAQKIENIFDVRTAEVP